jgi:hypothetical protein
VMALQMLKCAASVQRLMLCSSRTIACDPADRYNQMHRLTDGRTQPAVLFGSCVCGLLQQLMLWHPAVPFVAGWLDFCRWQPRAHVPAVRCCRGGSAATSTRPCPEQQAIMLSACSAVRAEGAHSACLLQVGRLVAHACASGHKRQRRRVRTPCQVTPTQLTF